MLQVVEGGTLHWQEKNGKDGKRIHHPNTNRKKSGVAISLLGKKKRIQNKEY